MLPERKYIKKIGVRELAINARFMLHRQQYSMDIGQGRCSLTGGWIDYHYSFLTVVYGIRS